MEMPEFVTKRGSTTRGSTDVQNGIVAILWENKQIPLSVHPKEEFDRFLELGKYTAVE